MNDTCSSFAGLFAAPEAYPAETVSSKKGKYFPQNLYTTEVFSRNAGGFILNIK